MTSARKCAVCAGVNGLAANFCRHCGAIIRAPEAPGSVSVADDGDPLAGSASAAVAIDERRWFRELCGLCGIPIGISVVYAISVRVGGISALGDLLATGAMAAVTLGGAVMNPGLVRGALRLPAGRDLLATTGVALIGAPTLTAGFWMLKQLGFQLYTSYLTPYALDGWPAWVGVADMALVTPISEEVLFRGLVQPKLGQIIKPSDALIVQAALFSAMHLNPVILVTHFAMGLAFGWLRLRSGSLFPGMVLHGAWNAWVVWSS